MPEKNRRRTKSELHALALPFVRLAEVPAPEKITALIFAAAFSAALHPGVFGLFLLFGVSWWDWKLGSQIALAKDEWDRTEAQLGKLGKTTQLLLVGAAIALEIWISHHPEWPETRGLISGVLAFWWVIDEVKSILRQLKSIGRRVPAFLDRWLDYGQAQLEARLPAPPEPHAGGDG